MRSEADVNRTITKYADTVQRICLCHLKNHADAEDMFQNIFIKYMMYDGEFQSEEHKKAWLLCVSVNACRDYLRTHFWKKAEPLDNILYSVSAQINEDQKEVLAAVLSLPEKYKDAIYLHYYEGYKASEIAEIIGKKENTVYSLLARGRNILRNQLGGGIDGQ